MAQVFIFFKKNSFNILTFLILIIALIIRFYGYSHTWGLAYDQAHDVIISQYALLNHKLPLLGPFSSAGAFQTGGEWYWFIMLGIFIFPYTVLGPWIFLTLINVIFVLCSIIVGRTMINKTFGLILGLFAAISTVEISQSINLTNQAPQSLLALLSIWSAILYRKKEKDIFTFLLGFFVSLAISIHLQGVSLLLFVFIALVFIPIKNPKSIALLLLGLILPALPLLIGDSQHGFVTLKNMLFYYMHDQYRVTFNDLGRSWKTYLFIFWPTSIGNILGGNLLSGYLLSILTILVLVIQAIKRKTSKEIIICIFGLFTSIILLRYIHTPLFDNYLMFLHPYIFILIAYAVYSIYRWKLFLGIIILFLISFFTIQKDIKNIISGTNYSSIRSMYWKDFLANKHAGKSFVIYDYRFRSSTFVFPLIMYLQKSNLLNDEGYKIGFGRPARKDDPVNYMSYPLILGNKMGFEFVDLNSSNEAELEKSLWYKVTPKLIYDSTEQ